MVTSQNLINQTIIGTQAYEDVCSQSYGATISLGATYQSDITTKKVISTITTNFNSQSISFILKNTIREDDGFDNNYCFALDSIVKRISNHHFECINFTTSYFQGSKRLKLDKVKIGCAGASSPLEYTFDYNDFDFPDPNTFNIDHWGYMNDSHNNISLIPDEVEPYFESIGINVAGLIDSDRSPSTNQSKYGIGLLTEILDPYGNEAIIEYENHDVGYIGTNLVEDVELEHFESTLMQCSLNCVKTYPFTSNHAGSVKIEYQVNNGPYPIGNEEFFIFFNNNQEAYHVTETDSVIVLNLTANIGSNEVRIQSISNNNLILSVKVFHTNILDIHKTREVGGVRVKAITQSGIGHSKSTQYIYIMENDDVRSSGVLNSNLNYTSTIDLLQSCIPGYALPPATFQIHQYTGSASRQATFNPGVSSHVFYKEILEVIDTEDGEYSSREWYNTPTTTNALMPPYDVAPPIGFRYSSPTKIEVYNTNGQLENRKIFVNDYVQFGSPVNTLSVNTTLNSYEVASMQFNDYIYPLKSSYYRLSSITEDQRLSGGDLLNSVTSFSYKSNSNILTQKVVTSLGENQTAVLKYVDDIGSPTCMSASNKHMIGVPIEVEMSGQGLSKSKITYSCSAYGAGNGLILPIEMKSFDYVNNVWLEPTVTVTEYTTRGLPKKIRLKGYPTNTVIDYSWNILGKLTLINEYGRNTTYNYNNLLQLESIISPDAQTTEFIYDNLRRLEKIIKPSQSETVYQYDYAGSGSENSVNYSKTITGAAYDFSGMHLYDGLGREINTLMNGYKESVNLYDGFGRVKSSKQEQSSFYTNQNFAPAPSSSVIESWADGWPRSQGFITSVVNNQIVKQSTDENYNKTLEYTNFFGRMLKSERIHEGSPLTTIYSYDNRGNLESVQNPVNQIYEYEYDGENRLIEKTIPLQGVFTYEYYDQGWLEQETTPKGDVYEYEYNNWGELEDKKINSVLSIENTIGQSGPETGKVTSKNVRILGLGGNVQYTYNYDTYGRMYGEQIVHPWGTDSYTYLIDNADITKKITRSSTLSGSSFQSVDDFEFDAYGRKIGHTQSIAGQPSRFISDSEYNSIDQVTAMNLGGTNLSPLQKIAYQYNQRDWLSQINRDCAACIDVMEEEPNDGILQKETELIIYYNVSEIINGTPTILQLNANVEYYDDTLLVGSLVDSMSVNYNGPGGVPNFTDTAYVYTIGEGDPDDMAAALFDAMLIASPLLDRGGGDIPIRDPNTPIINVVKVTTRVVIIKTSCDGNLQDLFAQKIEYIQPHGSVPGGEQQFTGNINQIEFCIFGRQGKEKFAFAYDDLYRLTEMYYPQSADNDENDFNVTVGYADAIGNISGINRNGLIDVDPITGELTFGLMDELKYNYSGGVLTSVQEGANQDFGYRGASGNFTYNYGNITSAPGISSITYNELNLPSHIVSTNGDDLVIYYDAEGNKWYQSKQWATNIPAEYVPTNGVETKIYSRGLENINGQTKALYFDQGRAILNNGSLQRYEYYLRDHLGNNRVVFSDVDNNGEIDMTIPTVEVMETHTYYPFGMKIEGMESIEACPVYQPYGYSGKERLLIDIYDYGARIYMASIGRWTSVDPLADDVMQIDKSPYAYSWNNPINLTDPDGKCPWCIGAIVGAAVDYAFQVAGNLAQGKNLGQSMIDVDPVSILISATAGAASGGISLLSKTKKVSTLGKVTLENSVDIGESVVSQVAEGDVTVSQTLSDFAASKIGGKVNIDAPVNTKSLERQADRTARIAKKDPSSSGRAANAMTAQNDLKSANQLNQATHFGVQKVVEKGVQESSDGIRNITSGNTGGIPRIQPITTARDNTRVSVPLINHRTIRP